MFQTCRDASPYEFEECSQSSVDSWQVVNLSNDLTGYVTSTNADTYANLYFEARYERPATLCDIRSASFKISKTIFLADAHIFKILSCNWINIFVDISQVTNYRLSVLTNSQIWFFFINFINSITCVISSNCPIRSEVTKLCDSNSSQVVNSLVNYSLIHNATG